MEIRDGDLIQTKIGEKKVSGRAEIHFDQDGSGTIRILDEELGGAEIASITVKNREVVGGDAY